MKKHFVFLTLLLICMTNALPAFGFVSSMTTSGSPIRWNLASSVIHTNIVNTNSRAIRFFLANDGYSTTNTAAELNSVRAAFAQWQTIPGSTLKFEEGGLVVPKSDMINTGDKTNVVYWEKTNHLVNGGSLNIQGALGFCQYSFTVGGVNDGYFQGADIVLNGLDYQWHTDYINGTNNNVAHLVEDVACHEIGHFIGLDHSPSGGATMLFHSGTGVGLQVGPSDDEVSAVRFLYPIAATNATLGSLKGKVLIGNTVVPGAAVFLENAAGSIVNSTVALTNGVFTMRSIIPGNYIVRAYPLDPEGAEGMISPFSISSDYTNVNVNFLPSANMPVTIVANQTLTNDIPVLNGPLPYRIGLMRYPTSSPGSYRLASLPSFIKVGQNNLYMGIAGTNLPTANSVTKLTITGDGLTISNPIFQNIGANPTYHVISVQVSVAPTATPGYRSFVLTDGANTLYANGFLEIQPLEVDFNWDGLADSFQRKNFALWTGTNAAPAADPDRDGYDNFSEYLGGTNPNDAASYLKVKSITRSGGSTTITWDADIGSKFQIYSRADFSGSTFQPVGSIVPGQGNNTSFVDNTAGGALKFYKIQAVP